MGRRTPALTTEEGAGSLLTITAAALLVAVATLALMVQGVTQARQSAARAADLAALAGAEQLRWGRPDACEAAAAIAELNGGRLAACDVSETVIEVRVTYPTAGILGVLGPAERSARAGP